ncbi:uncharacterized protein LOC108835662 [Raphanus sativus]|uniref:Uncharacterized protein LOC108835662 n=1 Tax=Raphanus sativus TaxID=3726 RepID=A0A6J0LX44_RAPSA|nr:uncharacterized protein LOC108835662 [Raphanus sativus]
MALPPPRTGSGTDIILWKHGVDDYQDSFSASKTWEQLRERKPKVPWSKVVWFSQGVPWYSFITWLAIQNRLSTGERMRQWGLVQGCEFCGERDETRDHLFFACPYSYTIWEVYAGRLSTIYHVWRERNARQHHQARTSTDQLRRVIEKAVRNRIVSLRYKPDHKYGGLLQHWFQITS